MSGTPKWIDDLIEATCLWAAEISGIPFAVWRSDSAVAALTQPPEDWSDLAKDLWSIIAAPRFDREAFDRVLSGWSTRNLGADKAAESGAAHELEFYGGER